MKTIYIAGKIKGLSFDEVVKKFATAQTKLEAEGYNVINPIELLIKQNWNRRDCNLPPLSEEKDRSEILKMDIYHLTTFCNAIYLLSDWMDSRGAAMEFHIANVLGLEILAQDGCEYCVEMDIKAGKKVAVDA
ncbi:DUF4406 domain-containing protein [Arachidicoccus soli]|uniref:DUF4406 domain-containing protein n=1 Tax=Arachidicoccus soli TaxID=2341117 RepID=A0A386HQL1_9BACT|nr:DUF4406 domain-containing protein [Arachidicoccus soli]AYD48227.1 DUF4406 domain-containing protein [Arachidicoccus soli]